MHNLSRICLSVNENQFPTFHNITSTCFKDQYSKYYKNSYPREFVTKHLKDINGFMHTTTTHIYTYLYIQSPTYTHTLNDMNANTYKNYSFKNKFLNGACLKKWSLFKNM